MFLETARFQIDRGFYDLAAFSLEQALQLFLKAKLLEMGVDYPRTHSARRLLEMLSGILSGEARERVESLLRNYLMELGVLEDAYITSRYVVREYTRDEVERLAKVVEEVIRNIESIS
ncbi:MAG: DNA-binding protein [Thermoprotei archaeon]|nr:MAG: DNA-binding protein [Thermoprotei archaeon]